MEIRIFSPDCLFRGICDRVIRFSASEEFAGAGSFSLRVPISEGSRFVPESLIVPDGMPEAFVVESVRADSAAGICDIGGRGILSFFSRRALTDKITFAGSAEELLTDLASVWGSAVLPGPLSTLSTGSAAQVNIGLGHRTLLSGMKDIAAEAGVGLRLQFMPGEGGFVFSLWEYRRGGVILSRELGNLTGMKHAADFFRYLNRIHVAGNGGHVVSVSAAGLFDDGIDDASQPLREGWENAEDLAMERYSTDAEYRAALAARGRRILAQRRPRITVSAETDEKTAFLLRPGDICPIRGETLAAEAVCMGKSVLYDGESLHYSASLSLRG